jgi:hypothetical protein
VFFLVACADNKTGSDKTSNYNDEVANEQAQSADAVASDGSGDSAEPKLLDLIGDWKQSNPNSETSYQTATITNNTIEVFWNNEETSTVSLYWAGTFIPPAAGVEEYTWESVNDKEKTSKAIMASPSETKTFTYRDGIISYEVSALGMTTTVELVHI